MDFKADCESTIYTSADVYGSQLLEVYRVRWLDGSHGTPQPGSMHEVSCAVSCQDCFTLVTAYAMRLESSAAVIRDTPRETVMCRLHFKKRPGNVVHTYTQGPPHPVA